MSKTLIEKLAAAKELVVKLEQQIASAAILNDIREGDEVTIKYGRADTAREVSGKIVGIKREDGKSPEVVVLSDDFKSYKVLAKDIIGNASKVARDSEAASVEPTDNTVIEGNEFPADPLANA